MGRPARARLRGAPGDQAGPDGLAQITQGYTGRDSAAYAEKLAINERYLRNLSLSLDVEILLRTVVWMVRGKGWAWRRAGASPR